MSHIQYYLNTKVELKNNNVWICFVCIQVLLCFSWCFKLTKSQLAQTADLTHCWKLLDSFAQDLQEETLFKPGKLLLFDRRCDGRSTDYFKCD